MADVIDITPQYLVIYCKQCELPYYRSKKPFRRGEALNPADFVSLNDDAEPPQDGKPMICPGCAGMMTILTDAALERMVPSEPVAEATDPSNPERYRPTANGAEELFACGDGEDIKDVKTLPDATIIILTNKRLVRIHV